MPRSFLSCLFVDPPVCAPTLSSLSCSFLSFGSSVLWLFAMAPQLSLLVLCVYGSIGSLLLRRIIVRLRVQPHDPRTARRGTRRGALPLYLPRKHERGREERRVHRACGGTHDEWILMDGGLNRQYSFWTSLTFSNDLSPREKMEISNFEND